MTTKLTSAKKNALNKMNKASKDIGLGTVLENLGTVSTGSYTTVLAEISASRVAIDTGLGIPVGGALVSVTRSGSAIANASIKYVSGSVAGTLIVTSASAPAVPLTVGDVINYVAFK